MNEAFKNDTLYFYWGIGTAYILPFIKNQNKKVVRFHGADIYLERRANRYIPFRKEVYTHLTKAIFISQQGLRYARQHYGDYHFEGHCCYLGTKDYGQPSRSPRSHTLHLLSCSNVIPVKRVHLIVEALATLNGISVEWTHIGDGEELEQVKEKSKQLPAHIQAHFPGRWPNAQVIAYYQSHPVDLFINVSSSEGLPVTLMEAISFDIPVIATNVGGTSEIVTPETGILIEPNCSPERIGEAILHLYEQREEYHPRAFWQQHFSAEKNYHQFISEILLPLSRS